MDAKQNAVITAITIAALLTFGNALYAETQPPAEGGVLPDISLRTPESEAHQRYLGISGKDTFAIPEIKAEVVLVEIFSMY